MAEPDKPTQNPAIPGQHGGRRLNQTGRPKGSINGPQAQFKALARQHTGPAIKELVRLAGFAPRIDKATGEQMIDSEGNPMFLPGSSSDTARIAAINILLERGWGKATQKLAGDSTEDPIRNEHIRTERVIVGARNPNAHKVINGTAVNADEPEEAPREEEKRA